jgi:hypothetical protein
MTNGKLYEKDQSPQASRDQTHLRLIYSHTAANSQKTDAKNEGVPPNPCRSLLAQLDRLASAIEVEVNLLSGL